MTRRISSLLLTTAALTTLTACDPASVVPARADALQPPSQGADDGSLFMKWLTRQPGGVNGLKPSDD